MEIKEPDGSSWNQAQAWEIDVNYLFKNNNANMAVSDRQNLAFVFPVSDIFK